MASRNAYLTCHASHDTKTAKEIGPREGICQPSVNLFGSGGEELSRRRERDFFSSLLNPQKHEQCRSEPFAHRQSGNPFLFLEYDRKEHFRRKDLGKLSVNLSPSTFFRELQILVTCLLSIASNVSVMARVTPVDSCWRRS
jgi:hypothetical protein